MRQQAAVQAARLAVKHWEKIPKEQKPAVRQHLLQVTMQEQTDRGRHSNSRLLAAIASLDFEDGEWPDLLPALFNLATSAEVGQRETASYIFYSVLEENPTALSDHIPKLLELLSHTLRDPQSAEVRINSLLSVGALLVVLDPENDEESVAAFQTLIPSMVDVLKGTIQDGDMDRTDQAFLVFQQFLAYESALLGKYLKDLVLFMIELGANKAAEDEVRSQALSFLAQTVRHRRMKLQGMKDVGQELTQKSLLILTEIDEDDDEEDMSPARTALALLDQLASDLPPRQVIVPLLDALPKFAASNEAGYRKAGILALGTVVEGAPDFITTQVKSIMPVAIQLLNDADIGVRHTALIGLARLAEDLSEELSPYNEPIMRSLVMNLQAAMEATSDPKLAKKNIEIIRAVCAALDAISDGLDAEFMKQYAGELIQNIGALVSHSDFKVKIAASGALGAIAESLGEDFKPYFEQVVRALGAYLMIKDSEDDLALRSAVLDAMGRVATAVGAETFQPYVMDLMRSSEEALHLDNSRLRESSFILWSSLAKVYEKDFAPFLPGVFKGLFQSLELEEEEIKLHLSEEEKGIVGTDDEFITGGKKLKITNADDDADLMDDEDEDDFDISASAEAMEKEVAIEILGDVITSACGTQEISEYLERAIEKVSPLAEHSYEGCRKAAVSTLWRSYARVWQLMEQETGTNWEPGLPLKQTPTVTLVKLGEIVSKATITLWHADAERYVLLSLPVLSLHDDHLALLPSSLRRNLADAENA